jgi:hypothetical protein
VTEWAQEARRDFLNPDLLKKLFVLEENFLARCSPAELEILHRRWGHDVFAAVTADVLFPTHVLSVLHKQSTSKLRRFVGKLARFNPFSSLSRSPFSADVDNFTRASESGAA